MATPSIPFLTDNNVPDSVGDYLASRGHTVTRIRDVMPTDSVDPVGAKAAIEAGQVLVTWDKDFKQPRYQGLSRVTMRCSEPDGVARSTATIDLIETALLSAQARNVPLVVQVTKTAVSIVR